MELVEATAENLDALVERWYTLASSMEEYDKLNELTYADVNDVSGDGFRALLDEEAVTIYLIVHEGESIGYVTLREGHHSSRKYSQYLRIVDLIIDEGHRNQGHGAEVVNRVKEVAQDWDCDHLKVSCEWHNEGARRFYRETGLRPKQVDYALSLE
ncbi:GNAT family N-acetyltransferase [Natrinema gelatinilyticum]|uniref:GNAT family N-acetyltransferase n=1 Tax=Natrinema gelatinilyticum TaxID=2961571 RepID=UPI0020C566D8|nr:GNAT family N-acetyltransferase [Natrinema gelatinilyticum]